jgi:quinone-modifying oxidoreductase subunit QmoC
MIQRLDPTLIREVGKFGKGTWNECFHCGECTASCPLSEQGFLFPRKGYRAIQMGLRDTLASSIEPWLCYYCGDCSEKCPRNANPGETMMILRRYLTSVYDWTGLSKKFYISHWWELGAVFIISLFTTLLFTVFNPHGIVTALNPDGGVRVNEMFPVEWVNIGAHIMAISVASILITNILRMWYFILLKDNSVRIPLISYVSQFASLVIHFATQKRFNKCESKNYWAIHWFLMSGYTLMFILIVGFLTWFQTEKIYAWYEPQRLLGYYATFGLLTGLIYFFWGRIKKTGQKFRFSHPSDWIFIILLFLTTISGILLHIFRINGMPVATYYSYIAHLAFLVPMICIEVPFSKWSHLAYRPFAIYFSKLKKAAILKELTQSISNN